MSSVQKIIILFGILLILAGIFLPYLIKFPLFRLPGDIIIEKPNFKVYIPITSMILISGIITLFIWIIRKI